jgi:hypothetical protein
LERKIGKEVYAYSQLLLDVQSDEELKEHTIAQGGNMGKVNYKQQLSKSQNF